MRTFKILFTFWDDNTNKFKEGSVYVQAKNKTFVEMFNVVMEQYNAFCSNNLYDINWINEIVELKDVA